VGSELQESDRARPPKGRRRRGLWIVGALLLSTAAAAAGRTPELPGAPSFARDVLPVLGQHCESCHGADEQHGGLRLDSYDGVMRGGDSGPAVIARDAGASLLVAKIEHRDRPFMPPRKRLPRATIARLRAWIVAGAAP
jgi:hypothetical protein